MNNALVPTILMALTERVRLIEVDKHPMDCTGRPKSDQSLDLTRHFLFIGAKKESRRAPQLNCSNRYTLDSNRDECYQIAFLIEFTETDLG